jgi:predicted porin/outer membrane murein-binding lipoprotein Lpp
MNRYKTTQAMLLAAGALSVALPQYMRADDLDDLKAKVQALSAQVDQLQQQQQAAAATKPGAPAPATPQPIWRPWSTPPTPKEPGPAINNGPLSATISGATFTIYGDIDIYANHMTSDSGHTINALEDGAILRSRWGIKGDKPVAPGYEMKFVLESGFNVKNGRQADTPGQPTNTTSVYSGRLFDRQAWLGLLTPIGEFRVGRQNTTIQQLGGEIDFAARNLGGVINLFGVPSRYDNDISFLSVRFCGFSFQGHYAFGNDQLGTATTNSVNGNIANIGNQRVYQLMLDYKQGPFTAGYMEIVAAPPAGGTNATAPKYATSVVYLNPYVNYDYGKGKVWFSTVHSNNNGATYNAAGTTVVLFNGGSPLGNTGQTANAYAGTLNTGNLVDLNTYYNIYQGSASYIITDKLVVGALYGWIRDITYHVKNAHGYAAGAFYDVFKDTHTYLMYDVIHNDRGAGFTQAASAGLSPNFTAANDVNGRKITGLQLGVMYNF